MIYSKERTVDALWTACGRVSQLFPKDECRRHSRHHHSYPSLAILLGDQ